MPTQYGRLLKTPPRDRDPLRAGLNGLSRSALAGFLRQCNEARSLEEQIPTPPAGADYADYDPRLLALLWARAAVLPAAQALAQRSGAVVPATPSYGEMADGLLRRLWELAEDGAALHELLRRRDSHAEVGLLRLYNRNRSTGRLPEPVPQAGYDRYPRVLLAVLWALAGNDEALRALGRRLRLAVPEPPAHNEMSDRLLEMLWKLGRDGEALRERWRRQGLLPVAAVGKETPEAVLGFLAWHEQRTDAREELMRRYRLLDATPEEFLKRFNRRRAPWPYDSVDEFRQDVRLKFLEQVETWDYLGYPVLEHRLFRSVRNRVIDLIRTRARQPRTGDLAEIEEQPTKDEPPDATPALLDGLPPLDYRVVLKAKFGIELTPEELDWSARHNLEERGLAAPTADQLAQERERIGAWLRQHASPTGRQLAECFLGHDPCKFDRALRDWRLRQAADECSRRVEGLLSPADTDTGRSARQATGAMAALIKRGAGGKRRSGARQVMGTVPLFAALQEAGNELWHRLGQRALDRREADDFGAGRERFGWFCEQFPILCRLAACYRLTLALIREGPPAVVRRLGKLAGWLEGGQWLATFPERDRLQCRSFLRELKDGEALFPPSCRAGRELLLLWLSSTEQTGLPEPRLADLDRAWWLSRGVPPADELVGHAFRGRWARVGEVAAQMLQKPAEARRIIWSAGRERDDCLHRLHRAQSATLVKLASCRRLVDCLRDGTSAPLDGLTDQLEEGNWQAVLEQVQRLAPANGRLGALRLLGLWARSLAEDGLPGQKMQDLDRVWSLSHEPGYNGPPNLPEGADELVTAAWQGSWSEVARGARRLIDHCPDGELDAWSARHEFRGCLRRLAERRERGR